MQRIVPEQRWRRIIVLFCGFVFLFSIFISTVAVAHAQEAEDPAPVEEAEASSRCANPAIPSAGIPLEIPLGVSEGNIALDLPDYLGKFFQFVIATIAILAAVKIIIAGFNWTFAAGSQEKIGAAKEDLSSAIWGLMIALLSYSILNIVNPKLVEIPPICPPTPASLTIETGSEGKPCTDQSDCGYTGEFHCAVTSSWRLVDAVWDFTGTGTERTGQCVDGSANDWCVGVDGTAHEEWCQSGSCVGFKCQEHIKGHGDPCNDLSGGLSIKCQQGLLCLPWNLTCSDGSEGSSCQDHEGKTADQYCQSGLTCKDNKCSK